MAVFGWDGPKGEQGFHYHKKTHDAFMITEGILTIYVGDEARILYPGDFAYAPPVSSHWIIGTAMKLINANTES